MQCRVCNAELKPGVNCAKSSIERRDYICRSCRAEQQRERRKTDPTYRERQHRLMREKRKAKWASMTKEERHQEYLKNRKYMTAFRTRQIKNQKKNN